MNVLLLAMDALSRINVGQSYAGNYDGGRDEEELYFQGEEDHKHGQKNKIGGWACTQKSVLSFDSNHGS